MTTTNNNSEKVLVNFHIGRGGRFFNQGHLTFKSVGGETKSYIEEENFLRYENEEAIIEEFGNDVRDLITDLDSQTEGDNYDEFCKKYGNLGGLELCYNEKCIGDYQPGICEYSYDIDGEYNTSYGVLIDSIEDLSEKELDAVKSASNRYELEIALGFEFSDEEE